MIVTRWVEVRCGYIVIIQSAYVTLLQLPCSCALFGIHGRHCCSHLAVDNAAFHSIRIIQTEFNVHHSTLHFQRYTFNQFHSHSHSYNISTSHRSINKHAIHTLCHNMFMFIRIRIIFNTIRVILWQKL